MHIECDFDFEFEESLGSLGIVLLALCFPLVADSGISLGQIPFAALVSNQTAEKYEIISTL